MKNRFRSLIMVTVLTGVSLFAWAQAGKFVSRPTEKEFKITGIDNVNYIDVDSDGMMYVSAQVQAEVQIYRPDGTLELKFGHKEVPGVSLEDDPMGLKPLSGVSVDKDHNIYVCEGSGSRVRVFNSFGEPLMTIYLTEFLAKIYDENGVRIYKAGDDIAGKNLPGRKVMGRGMPSDAVVSENGNIYISDVSANRILVFDYEGNFLTSFETISTPDGTGNFKNPSQLEINSKGELFITQPLANQVLVLDAKGNYLRYFGKTGNTVGAFQGLSGMDIDDLDRVYCADYVIGAVQVFDDQGNFLHALTGPGGEQWKTASIRGIAVDTRRIYLCEQPISSVHVRKFVK